MTAVEWLVDQMFKQGYFDGNKPLSITNLDHLQHQAKEMEKQQMHKCASFWRGKENEIEIPIFEQWYNTYGSKGSDEKIISQAHTNITRIKDKEYAPTSNEIQTEIEKLGNSINLLSHQDDVFYSHNDVLEMMKKFHTYEMNIELNMLKLTPLKITSSQTVISDGEIQSTAETFWTEPQESDMKRGWKLGARWYREQLKSRQ